jgi:hypothetical protein
MMRRSWQWLLHDFNGKGNVPPVRFFDDACSLDIANKLTRLDVGNITDFGQIHSADTLRIIEAAVYTLLEGK